MWLYKVALTSILVGTFRFFGNAHVDEEAYINIASVGSLLLLLSHLLTIYNSCFEDDPEYMLSFLGGSETGLRNGMFAVVDKS